MTPAAFPTRLALSGLSAWTATRWRRAVWMRLGALNGPFALSMLLLSDEPVFLDGHATSVRIAAQVQFMHGMATLACATFMNAGAVRSRRAPVFFFAGVIFYCLPTYAEAVGWLDRTDTLKSLGLGAFAVGWLIMAWSARDIDRNSDDQPFSKIS